MEKKMTRVAIGVSFGKYEVWTHFSESSEARTAASLFRATVSERLRPSFIEKGIAHTSLIADGIKE